MLGLSRAAARENARTQAEGKAAREAREARDSNSPSASTPTYRNGRSTPSKSKLSFLKSSTSDRSQSSLQSAATPQAPPTSQAPSTSQAPATSPPISPVDADSLIESPVTVPTSTSTLPTSPDDYHAPRPDHDRRPPLERNASSNRSGGNQPPRNRLRRREGHPSSPSPGPVSPSAPPPYSPLSSAPPIAPPIAPPSSTGANTGSAGRPPSRAIESPTTVPIAAYSWNVEGNSGNSRKGSSFARRFFSFGTQSSFGSIEAAASPWPAPKLGRSGSVRSKSVSETAPPIRSSFDVPSAGPAIDQRSVSGTTLEEEDEADGDHLPRKIQNRHSVAFPTPNIPEDAQSLVSPGALDFLQSTGGGVGPAPAAESTESKAPANHLAPEVHGHHSSQLSVSTISTNARQPRTDYLGAALSVDSRPPSRQSLEAPSPVHSATFLRHKVSSSASLGEAAMSNTGASGRGESGHQASQSSSSREGQYGTNLSVNNQRSAGGHGSPASPMGQNNSDGQQQRGTTPPPSRSRDDVSQMDVQQLFSKHEELNDKYRKVKKYYFDKDAQVQQLQNTLAHQRLAQSRTSLDDNEYQTRFNRLDGAINNLAFNIRKDWKAVPRWLAPHVNQEATSTVSKEMTAVGRACISRWIVDEIFDRYFHPSLEPNLSSHLKVIERNLRRFAPPVQTEEDREALLAKISNWRLATLDGLQDMLNTHDAVEYRTSLTNILVEMLTSDLMMNLKDPPPPGLDAGVVGIIELAIAIASNLPLESRDVYIDYVMPGTAVNETSMKPDGTLPPLTNPGEGAAGEQNDRASTTSGEPKDGETKSQKVRFAAFMSVEVRGKNMLVKAPVYV